MSGGEEDTDEEAGFADLIGETRPIAKGPERVGSQGPRKPASGTRAEDSRPEPFRWPDPAERLRAATHGVNDAQLNALGRGDPEPEERVDLHGVRRAAGARLLGDRIESACQRGLRCVLVIHGRGQRSGSGEAVLRDALPGWLSQGRASKNVLAFAPAPNRLGGDGATLVLLRRR